MADHGFLGGPPRPRMAVSAEWNGTSWSISKRSEDGVFMAHRNEREKMESPLSVPCSLPRPLAEPPGVQRPPNRLGNAGTPPQNSESEVSDSSQMCVEWP
ncbi:hypothetical protein ES288_A07G195300v1 [Gossypium darwinii]|uniref:Uncharacterized protein n=1 Tax=Gossypium darwinii TaxID=34276 RepID=A0A5D2FXC0_GOSDA|nr:hypothetical protein ES288_A07G195300v1 [Gossypium darwinii]